jgi:serine/threonine-protein kinase
LPRCRPRPKGAAKTPKRTACICKASFSRDQLNQDATARAVECYQQALKLDPDYALALAGFSRGMSDLAGQNWIPRTEGYEIARTAAQKAVTLEPTLPEAHTALGWVLGWFDWNWKAADASFQRALELAPGSTLAINGAATFFGNLGNLDVAVGLFRRAVGLDPLNVPINRNLGLYCLAAGALQEAEAALTKTLHLSTQSGMTYCWRGLTRLAQGRLDEALADMQKEVSPIFKLVGTAIVHHARGEIEASDTALAALIAEYGADSPYQVAEVYGARGDADKAFEWLEKTYGRPRPRSVVHEDGPQSRQDPERSTLDSAPDEDRNSTTDPIQPARGTNGKRRITAPFFRVRRPSTAECATAVRCCRTPQSRSRNRDGRSRSAA